MGRVFGGRLLRRNCEPAGEVTPVTPRVLNNSQPEERPPLQGSTVPKLTLPPRPNQSPGTAVPKTVPVPQTKTEPQPLAKKEPLTIEEKAQVAKAEADKAEARLNASAQGRPLSVRTTGGAAFSRFLGTYQANVSTRLPSQSYIAAQTGLPESSWGSRVVLSPKDPNRPGVIISSSKQSEADVEKVVTDLRNSTTATLLAGALFNGGYKDTRANSILVARGGDYLGGILKQANEKLSLIPYYAAAQSEQQALAEAGGRNFRVASRRTERAASGGLGKRRFNGGISEGLGQTQAAASAAVSDTTKLIVARAKQQAFSGAAEVETKAKDAGKQSELVGYEIDFEGKRKDGVEYFVKTNEGQLYTLKHVGRNFEDPKGEFLPATTYGQFNVAILKSYEKNKGISSAEFHSIAMKYDLFPTKEGNIIYVDPSKRKPEQQTALREHLEKQYSAKGSISTQDVAAARLAHTDKPIDSNIVTLPRPPKPVYDLSPVAIESALANTRVGAVQSNLSPEAHQVFKEAAAQGISVRVVGRSGVGENLSFTYAFVKKERDASGRILEREVGQRIAMKRFGTNYRSDTEYFKVRDSRLAQELSGRIASLETREKS